MATRTILVVDDDEDARAYLAMLLSSMGYEVQTAESGEQALSHLAVPDAPAVVLLDLLMPGMSGLDVLDHIQRTRPALPVIVQSTVAEIKTVVDAVRRGASDYLTKPFQEQELELALGNVLEKKELKEEVSLLRRRLDENEGEFVSSHPRLLRIKEIARQVAPTDAPVLVLGESGVGKEVVARLIHACSRRQGQPFVKINCAALPQDLLESELFGYERGAFSGALREKPGMFEVAKRGTILLDEIGEMSCHLQAKLLHVLQDGQYTRLGGRHPMKAEARVVASTNIRLEEAVGAGRFRADLYFRLNVVRIDIPPLRDRREDIPLLCAHFMRSYAARYDSRVRQLPRELQEAFVRTTGRATSASSRTRSGASRSCPTWRWRWPTSSGAATGPRPPPRRRSRSRRPSPRAKRSPFALRTASRSGRWRAGRPRMPSANWWGASSPRRSGTARRRPSGSRSPTRRS